MFVCGSENIAHSKIKPGAANNNELIANVSIFPGISVIRQPSLFVEVGEKNQKLSNGAIFRTHDA